MPDGGLGNVGAFVGIQTLFVSPLIFAFAIAGLAVASLRGFFRQQANWLLLAAAAAPMLAYFFLHALSAEVLPQWPSAAYAIAVIAAVAAFAPRQDGGKTRDKTRRSAGRSFATAFAAAPWTGLVFTLALLAQMTFWPVPIVGGAGSARYFRRLGAMGGGHRARGAARMVPAYIANAEYDTDAELAFYLRDIPVFQTSEKIRYEFLPPIDQSLLARSTGIYVASEPFEDLRTAKAFCDGRADRDGLAHAQRRPDQGVPHLRVEGISRRRAVLAGRLAAAAVTRL